MDYSVRIRNLVLRIGGFGLELDDMRIAQGRFVALIGANGLGETSLLEALLGFRALDSGEVDLLGHGAFSVT